VANSLRAIPVEAVETAAGWAAGGAREESSGAAAAFAARFFYYPPAYHCGMPFPRKRAAEELQGLKLLFRYADHQDVQAERYAVLSTCLPVIHTLFEVLCGEPALGSASNEAVD